MLLQIITICLNGAVVCRCGLRRYNAAGAGDAVRPAGRHRGRVGHDGALPAVVGPARPPGALCRRPGEQAARDADASDVRRTLSELLPLPGERRRHLSVSARTSGEVGRGAAEVTGVRVRCHTASDYKFDWI